MQRRHDIDALRVIAFALLILYHVGMVYVLDWDYHVKSSYQVEWLQWPMIFINRWRMPLLFMISGIAIGLCQPLRAPLRFALLRSWRLLLPLVFGMLFIVPIQAYCEATAHGSFAAGFGEFMTRYLQLRPWPEGGWTGAEHGVTWNHLWYLAYLWVYTLLLMPLLPLLGSAVGQRLQAGLCARGNLALIGLPALLLFANLMLLQPRFPETHALVGDWYLHVEYFSVFLCGYVIARSERFWQRLQGLRWKTLVIALVAISIELSLRAAGRYLPPEQLPATLATVPWGAIERAARALYLWSALLAILGWGKALLDRPFPWLRYATEAVYPWYILHQSLIVLIAFWLTPMRIGAVWEPALVLLGTVIGCLALHELLIRRFNLLRVLFGLKWKPPIPGGGLASTSLPPA